MEVSTILKTQTKKGGTAKGVDTVAMKRGKRKRRKGSIVAMSLAKGAGTVVKNLVGEVGTIVVSLAKEASIAV